MSTSEHLEATRANASRRRGSRHGIQLVGTLLPYVALSPSYTPGLVLRSPILASNISAYLTI